MLIYSEDRHVALTLRYVAGGGPLREGSADLLCITVGLRERLLLLLGALARRAVFAVVDAARKYKS